MTKIDFAIDPAIVAVVVVIAVFAVFALSMCRISAISDKKLRNMFDGARLKKKFYFTLSGVDIRGEVVSTRCCAYTDEGVVSAVKKFRRIFFIKMNSKVVISEKRYE